MLPGSTGRFFIFHNHSVHWYYITLIRVGIILSTILLKSIVFMFTGGCKIQYICCVFNQNCSGLCHIYSWFLSMWWVLSLSVLLSICRVYIYIYMLGWSCRATCYFVSPLQCLVPGISHAVQMKRSSACKVIVEVLVLGLLVVVYFSIRFRTAVVCEPGKMQLVCSHRTTVYLVQRVCVS